MKKLLLITAAAALSTAVFSKEIVQTPIIVEEVAIAPAVIPAPIPVKDNYLALRVGMDFAGRYDQISVSNEFGYEVLPTFRQLPPMVENVDFNKKDADSFGGEIALEYTRKLWNSGFELGLGAAYQRHSDIEGERSTFSFQYDRGIGLGGEVDFDAAGFDSVPLYATARYTFEKINFIFPGWKPYIKADIGYSFNIGRDDNRATITEYREPDVTYREVVKAGRDIENGLYWGAGLGIDYQDWTFDVMYKVNTAKTSGTFRNEENEVVGKFSDNIDYSRIVASFGYRFNY